MDSEYLLEQINPTMGGIDEGVSCSRCSHFCIRQLIKPLIVAIGIVFGSTAYGQLQFTDEGKAIVDTVAVVGSVPKDLLYERAKEWMLRNLKSSDNQVSLDDDAKSMLIGTTNLLLPGKKGPSKSIHTDRVLNFKLSVSLKEGRYRVVVENIVYSYRFVRGTANLSIRNTMEELFLYRKKVEEKGSAKAIEVAHEPIADLDIAISDLLESLYASMRGEQSLLKDEW